MLGADPSSRTARRRTREEVVKSVSCAWKTAASGPVRCTASVVPEKLQGSLSVELKQSKWQQLARMAYSNAFDCGRSLLGTPRCRFAFRGFRCGSDVRNSGALIALMPVMAEYENTERSGGRSFEVHGKLKLEVPCVTRAPDAACAYVCLSRYDGIHGTGASSIGSAYVNVTLGRSDHLYGDRQTC